MNNTLKAALKEYFFGVHQETPRTEEEGKEESLEMYKMIQSLNLPWEKFDELEGVIVKANQAMEFQGFLQGYNYCLTMLNLAQEG